jgi:hypothetical protein
MSPRLSPNSGLGAYCQGCHCTQTARATTTRITQVWRMTQCYVVQATSLLEV